jgi:ribonuclease Z
MKFEVTILGCGSATPTVRHSPSAQLVNCEEQFYLVDCGEGTQLQLRRFRLKFQRINHIFISHLHGDHYFGLPGLLSTLHLLGRTKPVHIYAHPDLAEAVALDLKISHSRLRFSIHWHALAYDGMHTLMENEHLEVLSFPLSHRIPTCGFLFREKQKPRNMIPERIVEYNIPVARIRQIKAGSDYTLPDGRTVPNAELTTAPDPPKSFAYCSDTAYREATAAYVQGVDLLYHESTFLEEDIRRAKDTYHSTAGQAAKVASLAGVGRLVLGHYSARYRNIERFLAEANQIFPRTVLGEEGLTLPV